MKTRRVGRAERAGTRRLQREEAVVMYLQMPWAMLRCGVQTKRILTMVRTHLRVCLIMNPPGVGSSERYLLNDTQVGNLCFQRMHSKKKVLS